MRAKNTSSRALWTDQGLTWPDKFPGQVAMPVHFPFMVHVVAFFAIAPLQFNGAADPVGLPGKVMRPALDTVPGKETMDDPLNPNTWPYPSLETTEFRVPDNEPEQGPVIDGSSNGPEPTPSDPVVELKLPSRRSRLQQARKR